MDRLISTISGFEFQILFFVPGLAVGLATLTATGIIVPLRIVRLRQNFRASWSPVTTILTVILAFSISAISFYSLRRLINAEIKITALPSSQLDFGFEPVTFTFSTPIDMKMVITNQNPNLPGSWKKTTYASWLPFGRKITFIPNQSVFADEPVMLYLSNITKPFSREWGGEYLYETKSAGMPSVSAVSVRDGDTVSPTAPVKITLTAPPVNSVFTAESSPAAKITMTSGSSTNLTANFPDGLMQNTRYQLKIIRTPAKKAVADGTPLVLGLPETVATINFRTAKQPLISAVKPDPKNADPASAIVIEFEEPIDILSFDNKFKISPEITGTIMWSDNNKTVTFRPDRKLAKATAYKVILDKGLKNIAGGSLPEPFNYIFQTIGDPEITATEPEDKINSASVTKPIIIIFDQPVIKKTAEAAFAINPEINGSFSWKENVLIFTPEKPLEFNSLYTVTITAGIENALGMKSHKPAAFSFTTAPYEFDLKVPYLKQQESFTCNIAALRMLLSYRGETVSEKDLKKITGSGGNRGNGNPNQGYVSGYGTYWDAIARAGREYRTVRIVKQEKLTDLLTEVKNGNPFMIWGQNGWSDPHEISWTNPDGLFIYAINGMHSYVVGGWRGDIADPTHILVNDPWRGQYAMTAAQFTKFYSYFNTALFVD